MERSLPIRVAQVAGESLASYIDRLGFELNVSLIALLAHTGIASVPHWRAVPPGYGVRLEARRVAHFASVTGLAETAVEQMLLTRYDGIALDFSRDSSARIPAYAARIGWAYTAGSHYCAACLGETGAWQLSWKLPWTYICLRHGLLLQSHCGTCKRRAGSGRSSRESVPAYVSRIPQPGRCSALGTAARSRGRAARSCGADLGSAPNIPFCDPDAKAAQSHIEAMLAHGADTIAFGQRLPALKFFLDLRSLVSLFLFMAHPSDLYLADQVLIDALGCHVEERANQFRQRQQGFGRWAGRFYTAVPQDPLLLAAVIPAALRALTSTSPAVAAEELEWLITRLAGTPSGALPLPSWFRSSPRMRLVWSMVFDHEPSRHQIRSWGRRPPQPCNIPQLLWRPRFDADFASLIPYIRPPKARLYCSVALVKWMFSLTWPEAAAALDLPPTATAKLAYDVTRNLEIAGTASAFAQRIDALARSVQQQGAPIDYQARRSVLADLDRLEVAVWAAAWAPAAPPPLIPARERAAVAWLWAELTGADHRRAPAWRGAWGPSSRKTFGRFLEFHLESVEPQLRAYGAHLLAARGIA